MYRIGKKILDTFISAISIVILSPLFIYLSIWIKIDSPGPIFFKQKRVGYKKEYFEILKFRSMRVDAPSDMPTHLLKGSKTFITKSGTFLRKTSLDELPQLINILKGDMSFIGPRPALWNQYDLIVERDKYGANDIVPGLTGWAQINGRDELSITDKAFLDGEYVEKISFLFDINCLVGTIKSVFNSDGIIEGGTGSQDKKESSKDD